MTAQSRGEKRMKRVNVVLAGLGFGYGFVPIYRDHPQVGTVGLYDPDMALAAKAAGQFHADRVYASFEEVLEDPSVDAVHLITPIPLHAEQTVRVLESGKHCACTVPMATSLEDLQKITDQGIKDVDAVYAAKEKEIMEV